MIRKSRLPRIANAAIGLFAFLLAGGQAIANDLALSNEGTLLSWVSPTYPHSINIHRGNGEYLSSLPDGTNQYTVDGDGTYYIVASTDSAWQDWERSNDITVSTDTAPPSTGCQALPSHAELRSALIAANQRVDLTLNNEMWGVMVAEDGTVCAVVATGQNNLQSQWLASRVIAGQKANTANSLSLGATSGGANAGLSLSTANLWAAVQPGGRGCGTNSAYSGDAD